MAITTRERCGLGATAGAFALPPVVKANRSRPDARAGCAHCTVAIKGA
jgi:hypothetical protein